MREVTDIAKPIVGFDMDPDNDGKVIVIKDALLEGRVVDFISTMQVEITVSPTVSEPINKQRLVVDNYYFKGTQSRKD